MHVRPIDLDWAQGTFPAIFQVYGASALRRQIEAFNETVAADTVSHDDIEFAFAAMGRDLRNIHRPILNTLSLFAHRNAPPGPRAVLLHLEELLAFSLHARDNVSTYRDMLTNPQSYMELLAELDWATRLRQHGGTFQAHTKTNSGVPNDNRNYDLHWVLRGTTLHADVKWFKDWLVKHHGEDILRGQIWLIKPDLAHHIVVTMPLRQWHTEDIIKAAFQVLDLYRAALENRHDPRWVISKHQKQLQIVLRAAYDFPPRPDLLVENVVIFLPETGRGSVSVIETGAGGLEDIESARRNVRGAASQVPVTGTAPDISCVCIGSAVPEDSDDVKRALFGLKDGLSAPGMFDPKSTEPGYEHLHAAIHFSLAFEQAADNPRTVIVKRSVTVFSGPKAMNAEQEAFLNAVAQIYSGDSSITLP